jgi:hypothetical protein
LSGRRSLTTCGRRRERFEARRGAVIERAASPGEHDQDHWAEPRAGRRRRRRHARVAARPASPTSESVDPGPGRRGGLAHAQVALTIVDADADEDAGFQSYAEAYIVSYTHRPIPDGADEFVNAVYDPVISATERLTDLHYANRASSLR